MSYIIELKSTLEFYKDDPDKVSLYTHLIEKYYEENKADRNIWLSRDGYSGNFKDVPGWISDQFSYIVIRWRDLLIKCHLSAGQLAEEIAKNKNEYAQLEAEVLRSLEADKYLSKSLLGRYGDLCAKRLYGQVTDEHFKGDITRPELSKKEDIAANKQSVGAYITHQNRVDKTENKILEIINQLGKSHKKISKSGVAKIVGISREHISRRYSHLFKIA